MDKVLELNRELAAGAKPCSTDGGFMLGSDQDGLNCAHNFEEVRSPRIRVGSHNGWTRATPVCISMCACTCITCPYLPM